MSRRWWLAALITAPWALQVVLLWPLPIGSDAAAALVESLVREDPRYAGLAEIYDTLWRTWILRLTFIMVGVACVVLALRGQRGWAPLYLSCSFGYLLYFQHWRWFPLHADILGATFMPGDGYSWVWTRPVMPILVLFSVAIVCAIAYAIFSIVKNKHAI